MNNVLFSKNSDEWYTPRDYFYNLDKEFHFNLDPCSSDENFLCINHFTKEDNGLNKDWGGYTVFCNPPYSEISKWCEKCALESKKPNTVICLLIPARTDTKYFHSFVLPLAEIRFIKGRLHFGGSINSAPFPSILCVYGGVK